MTLNSKKKGNLWENRLSNWLKDHGIKAWRDPASGAGTREKADIGNNIDANIESKAGKAINIKEAYKQTEKNASMTHRTPLLFIHYDGMRDDEWMVVLNNYDWLELHKKSQEPKTVSTEGNRELKWALTALISSTKRLLKLIE